MIDVLKSLQKYFLCEQLLHHINGILLCFILYNCMHKNILELCCPIKPVKSHCISQAFQEIRHHWHLCQKPIKFHSFQAYKLYKCTRGHRGDQRQEQCDWFTLVLLSIDRNDRRLARWFCKQAQCDNLNIPLTVLPTFLQCKIATLKPALLMRPILDSSLFLCLRRSLIDLI